MDRFVNNRFLDALLKLMLFSATIHICILIYHSITSHDITVMNYFNILDLDFFMSDIAKGTVNNILSAVTMLIIYIVIFFFLSKQEE